MTDACIHCCFTRIPKVDDPRYDAMVETLPADSLARLAPMSAKRRAEFVTGRWLLRRAASRFMGIDDPGALETLVERGSDLPELPGLASSGHGYSLSHSGGLAAVAIAPAQAVGIDIEQVRPTPDIQGLLKQTGSAVDIERYDASGESERLGVFYGYWTRKESLIKLHRTSLASTRLRQLVSLQGWPGEATWVETERPECLAATWMLTGYAVSVATTIPFSLEETWLDEDGNGASAAAPRTMERWTLVTRTSN